MSAAAGPLADRVHVARAGTPIVLPREEYPGGIYRVNAAGADWQPALAALAAEMRLPVEGDGERQARLVAAFAAHVDARPDALVIFSRAPPTGARLPGSTALLGSPGRGSSGRRSHGVG